MSAPVRLADVERNAQARGPIPQDDAALALCRALRVAVAALREVEAVRAGWQSTSARALREIAALVDVETKA